MNQIKKFQDFCDQELKNNHKHEIKNEQIRKKRKLQIKPFEEKIKYHEKKLKILEKRLIE